MFFYLKWYLKKRTSFSGLEERQSELAKLIAEIDRITDRDSQLVEDRVNKLKTLLDDIDKKIAHYEKEIETQSLLKQINETNNLERERKNDLYTNLGRGIRAALKTEEPMEFSVQRELPPARIEPPLPVVAATAGITKKQIRSHIDLLINEGLSPDEISSRLGISIAEVNLAINLRR